MGKKASVGVAYPVMSTVCNDITKYKNSKIQGKVANINTYKYIHSQYDHSICLVSYILTGEYYSHINH